METSEKRMVKILNFGSLNLDYTYDVPHFVTAGETLSSVQMRASAGGKGLNQSIAASRSGAEIYHAGAVGQTDGGMLLDALHAAKVDTACVRRAAALASGFFARSGLHARCASAATPSQST